MCSCKRSLAGASGVAGGRVLYARAAGVPRRAACLWARWTSAWQSVHARLRGVCWGEAVARAAAWLLPVILQRPCTRHASLLRMCVCGVRGGCGGEPWRRTPKPTASCGRCGQRGAGTSPTQRAASTPCYCARAVGHAGARRTRRAQCSGASAREEREQVAALAGLRLLRPVSALSVTQRAAEHAAAAARAAAHVAVIPPTLQAARAARRRVRVRGAAGAHAAPPPAAPAHVSRQRRTGAVRHASAGAHAATHAPDTC